MTEKIPTQNGNDEKVGILSYFPRMRKALAAVVRRLARAIEGDIRSLQKEEEQINESRRNLLKGGLFFAASAAVPKVNLDIAKLNTLNLSPENFTYLAKLININGSTNDALLAILRSFTDSKSVFNEVNDLKILLDSGQIAQMDEKAWIEWLNKNTNYLRESWSLISSWVNKDFDLSKLKNPEIYSALESLGLDINKEVLEKLSSFGSLGNLQDRLRADLFDVFSKTVEQYKKFPQSKLLKKHVLEISNIMQENLTFRRWVEDTSGGMDFLGELHDLTQEIINKENLARKLKNGELPNKEELKYLESNTFEISPSAILTNSYAVARAFVRKHIGKDIKTFALIAPNYTKNISLKNSKQVEFMQEFKSAGANYNGFVKVVLFK